MNFKIEHFWDFNTSYLGAVPVVLDAFNATVFN